MVIQIIQDMADHQPVKPTTHPRLFNKIVLTLENSLIPENKLDETPSYLDGLDKETEKDLRILGCELIQTAGILLKLPQVAMATGQILFQRFYYSKSFVRHHMETTAMSCICLASKIEEAPRRVRDVINVIHHIKQVRAQKVIMPMILDQSYTNLKNQVIKAERRVLKELGFCVHIKHPHKLIVMYLQVLSYEKHERLMQIAWNFMNDSLRTDVFMRYQPETIACACIYLTARKLGICLPNQPSWYGIFKVTEEHIIDICYRVMELYKRTKPNVEKLDAAVEELKKRYVESRNKTKEQNTPPAVTTVDRNNGSHNAWGGFIQRTLPLPIVPIEIKPIHVKRSTTRSRTRSHSPRSRSKTHTPTDEYHNKRSSSSKKPRHRSKTPTNKSNNKKKSRHYSRSASSSPHSKHRKRNDRNHYSNGGGGRGGGGSSAGGGGNNNDRKDRNRTRSDRDRRDKRSSGGHSSNHRGKYRDRSRDRKR